jgi:hypothetical protein
MVTGQRKRKTGEIEAKTVRFVKVGGSFKEGWGGRGGAPVFAYQNTDPVLRFTAQTITKELGWA